MAKRRRQSNAVLWVLVVILLVCFVAIGYVFYTYFYAGTSSTKYGNRLDDIDNYPLPKTLESDIKNLYKDDSIIADVKYELQGKIIYIIIDFNEPTSSENAQGLAVKSLELIGETNLTYYEVQYILNYKGEEESNNFPIFGAKSVNSLKVVWSVKNEKQG